MRLGRRSGSRPDLGGRHETRTLVAAAGYPAKIAESVRQAEARLSPAKAAMAHGREASLAFNRRFHMRDGTVGWNPGKLNPKILKPAGTIDPDVPVVYFESVGGKPLAT